MREILLLYGFFEEFRISCGKGGMGLVRLDLIASFSCCNLRRDLLHHIAYIGGPGARRKSQGLRFGFPRGFFNGLLVNTTNVHSSN